MQRSNKVVFLAHCLINQNCVVNPYARARGAYKEIVDLIMEKGIGIELLPCPETLFAGILRLPKNKAEYDTQSYRNHCAKLAHPVIEMIKHYLDAKIEVVGIIGVGSSPTCDISGEENGIFMEELKKHLEKDNIPLRIIDISEDFQEGRDNSFELNNLNKWLDA